MWPIAQLVMLVPAALIVLAFPGLRPLASSRRGAVQPGLIVLTGATSAMALLVWVRLAAPDLASATAMVPDLPLYALLPGALVFALVNATLEEVVFRGLLQSALNAALRSTSAAVVLQALAFGAAHYHGVPNGPLGATMAGTWALILGWARTRSGGLRTPILGHIVADLVIFGMLLSS